MARADIVKVALVNPNWQYDGSIYFGCREAHFPLELAYAQASLDAGGHETAVFDGQLLGMDDDRIASAVADFRPEMTVVTTAPTYLFWRCAPPELRTPRSFLDALDRRGGREVAVGPHGSATPVPTLKKLGVDVVVRGECEDVVRMLADNPGADAVPGTALPESDGGIRVNGGPQASRFVDTPALAWPDAWVQRHHHHHHRFDRKPSGPGAEVEASRGCPYSCSFCAKIDFRDKYRRRALPALLKEIDSLLAQGVRYIYFVDEIFLPQRALLEALCRRDVQFGVQTRIDLWKPDMLSLLGEAGCVSVEAGVESLTEEGRDALDKNCRLSTDRLAELLLHAREAIPFVQANLIATDRDDPDLVRAWRERLRSRGVWANDPVPLYPYPSSPDYFRLWGPPDDRAWERAHEHYLRQFERFSDIQDARPAALEVLEGQWRTT